MSDELKKAAMEAAKKAWIALHSSWVSGLKTHEEDLSVLTPVIFAAIEQQVNLAVAEAYEDAARECEKHGQFCKDEMDKGGNITHLSAHCHAANWNALKIRRKVEMKKVERLEKPNGD